MTNNTTRESCHLSAERCTLLILVFSNDACMTFLTENVPLGNAWEGGYDVSLWN